MTREKAVGLLKASFYKHVNPTSSHYSTWQPKEWQVAAVLEAYRRGDAANESITGALQGGVYLVETSIAHISHGGPTQQDAVQWLHRARVALLAKSVERTRKDEEAKGEGYERRSETSADDRGTEAGARRA